MASVLHFVVIADALGPLMPHLPAFARAGFGVPEEKATLAEAAEAVRNGKVDLVVLPMSLLQGKERIEVELMLREARSMATIATAPAPDADLILMGMRSGIDEFLVSPPSTVDLEAALVRLQRKWGPAQAHGSVTVVYSPKGGVGNTTVAVNLAHSLAVRRNDSRVLVVDLNMGLGDVVSHLDLKHDYDVGDLVRKLDRADADLVNALVTPATDGLSALPATDDLVTADVIQADAVARVLVACRHSFSHTVVDCEHSFGPRTVAALDAADRIVLLLQSNVAAIRAAKRTLALFEQLEYPAEKIVVVLNREGPGDVLPASDVAKALGRPVDVRLPNAYQLAVDAQTRGIPIGKVAPTSALARRFSALATRVSGEVAVVEDPGSRGARPKRGGFLGLGRR
jgi:pilus assembly protein CpaE